MKLEIYRHLWGIEKSNEEIFPIIQKTGLYAGIESPLPVESEEAHFKDLLAQQSFSYIPMIFTSGANVNEHLASFERQLKAALRFKPAVVTAHTGADWFPLEDAITFFKEAARIENDLGAAVAHETHRGRILFNPWVAQRILNQVENVRLCADFSHWVCVGERLLDTKTDIIPLIIERVIHIHSRVGYEEGPQVPDPRAPEYASHLHQHESWWDLIWESQKKKGMAVSTMTPEFGPSPYLHTLPYTQQPVASLWDICNWQAQRQSERFIH